MTYSWSSFHSAPLSSRPAEVVIVLVGANRKLCWWALNRVRSGASYLQWLTKLFPRSGRSFRCVQELKLSAVRMIRFWWFRQRSLISLLVFHISLQASPFRFLTRHSLLTRWCVRSVSDGTRDERYIQYSNVPTDHFQPGLPRLPIPKLDQTLQRYLASLKPVCSEEEFRYSQTCVAEFEKEGQCMCHFPSVSLFVFVTYSCTHSHTHMYMYIHNTCSPG